MRITRTATKEMDSHMETVTHGIGAGRRWTLRSLGLLTGLVAVVATATSAGAATSTGSFGTASGSVASLSGSSMEVQGSGSQTTVSWTGTTTFTKTVTETVGAVVAGDCVTVTGTPGKKSKTTIAARSITIATAPASGSCTTGGAAAGRFGGGAGAAGGFGGFSGRPGGSGGFTGGSGTGRPAGGFPAGGAAGRKFFSGGSFTIASGKVTGVTGSTISVSGIVLSNLFSRTKAAASKTAKGKKPKITLPKPESLKVTTGSSTTLTETQPVTASALATGDCVTAAGQESSTGAVTAATVRITSTGATSCTTTGFGGGGFGGGGFGGGGPGGPGGA